MSLIENKEIFKRYLNFLEQTIDNKTIFNQIKNEIILGKKINDVDQKLLNQLSNDSYYNILFCDFLISFGYSVQEIPQILIEKISTDDYDTLMFLKTVIINHNIKIEQVILPLIEKLSKNKEYFFEFLNDFLADNRKIKEIPENILKRYKIGDPVTNAKKYNQKYQGFFIHSLKESEIPHFFEKINQKNNEEVSASTYRSLRSFKVDGIVITGNAIFRELYDVDCYSDYNPNGLLYPTQNLIVSDDYWNPFLTDEYEEDVSEYYDEGFIKLNDSNTKITNVYLPNNLENSEKIQKLFLDKNPRIEISTLKKFKLFLKNR